MPMPPKNDFFTNIRQFIANDDLQKALDLLLKNNPEVDEVILHVARFHNIQKQIRQDIITPDTANIAKNKIRVSLLDLLGELESQITPESNIEEVLKESISNIIPKLLPLELSENLFTNNQLWFKNLRWELIQRGVAVRNKAPYVFEHYGWLIEVFLQKMSTEKGKERNLRRLSFIAEAYGSSIRYLCYIQLVQLLSKKKQLPAFIKKFFQLTPNELQHFNFLNFLPKLSESLEESFISFIPEINLFIDELNNPNTDLYGAAHFLENNRQQLIKNALSEQDNVQQLLDEYLTALVFWLRKITFLANYRLVSIKNINLNYRLGTTKNFVHQYGELHGMYNKLEQDDFTAYSIQDRFTYNQSILLFKGKDIEQCLKHLGKKKRRTNTNKLFLSLSPLIIDQSVFSESNTQTPEIYYYTGKNAREYHFNQYKNELAYKKGQTISSNKTLVVKNQNIQQPKLDELFEHIKQIFPSFKNAQS